MKEKEKKEMMDLLVELADTKFWSAIKKYNSSLLYQIDNLLRSLNPYDNPTDIARTQGQLLGIFQLQRDIEAETEKRKNEIKKQRQRGKNLSKP